MLRPTVRLLDSASSGKITGTVDSGLIATLGSGKDCSVYVYEGFDSPLNDIYIPMKGTKPATHNNPITTAKISSDGTSQYTAAFVPEGNYTIAVACDVTMDSAMTVETLPFSDPQNVSIVAGSTTTVNFAAPVTP
jgi:hypothetical protein